MSQSLDPNEAKVVLPEGLREQLEAFRKHLWRVKIMEAAAAGIIGLVVSFLLVYFLDRLMPTPGLLRLGILIAGVSLFAVFVPYWLHRWVWRQRREMQLAKLIAKRFPGLGDRLLGVIELQGQAGSADSLSPRLREAAMEAVAAEAGRRQLDDALPPQQHRRWGMAAFLLVLVVTAAFFLTPRASQNALKRWILPLSNTERYTFTKLENPPRLLTVPVGEAFDVRLDLAKQSEQRPEHATARYGLQGEVLARLRSGSYHFTFPGQQTPGTVVCKVGDLRHEIRVEPMQRPGIESVNATVIPPAYLGIPERTQDLGNGVLSVVEGSEMRIDLNASRALARGSYGPTRAQSVVAGNEARSEFQPNSGDLQTAGKVGRTPVMAVGAVPMEIPVEWTDTLGLEGEAGFLIRVNVFQDAKPAAYLQGVDRQKAMLPEETLEFELLAEDDFGIKEAGIEWKGEFTRATDERPAEGALKLIEGGAEKRRGLTAAMFSPVAFDIGPQKILLRAYVEDFFPERGRVYSEPIVLYILSRDEHAQMLKNQFDRNIGEFEDLARRETDLLDENQRLERLPGEELQGEEAKKRLQEQEQAESETQRRMDELTQRMEELMKSATRNGEIEKETLKKMAESLKSMQELSREDVPKVEAKLAEAQESSNEAAESKKDVSEAVEAQKEVVEKMEEAIAKANEAKRQFEAGTFVNRLKKAAGEQDGIAGALIDAFDRILGRPTSKVDPSDVRRLTEVTRQQVSTASDVRWIQEDLGNFYARTKDDGFKNVLEAMRGSGIDLALEGVRGLLVNNQSFKAAEGSKKWADQLREWAAALAAENEKNAGGGGGGGGPSPEDEDFEFMLRVMKLIQQEQDIRAQTRALEQVRRTYETTPPSQP